MTSPMGMVILRINKNFLDNVILVLLSIRMRGCPTIDKKGKIMIPYDLLVLGVVKDIRVGVWQVEMVVMGVVRLEKDCPKEKANVREGKKVSPSDVGDGPLNRNRFYALQSKGDQE